MEAPQLEPRPVRVYFPDLEALVPARLEGAAVQAWLSAPIAGEPLYRRVLESLLLHEEAELILRDGRVARALAAELDENPCYGMRARCIPADCQLDPAWPAPMLELPGEGPLCGALEPFLERARASNTARRMSCRDALDHRPDAAGVVYRPAGSAESGPALLDEDQLRVFPSGSAEGLRALSLAALEGELPGHETAGRLEGNLLLGPRCSIAPGVRLAGVAAVGEESAVSSGVELRHGAAIGAGCYIGEGAVIEDALILDGTEIGPGEQVVGQVRYGKDVLA